MPVARCLALIDKKNYQTSHSGFRSPDFKKNTQKQLPVLEITLLEPNTYDAPKPRQPMTTRVIPETLASSSVVSMLKLLWSGGCWKGTAAYSDTTSGICRCAVQDGRWKLGQAFMRQPTRNLPLHHMDGVGCSWRDAEKGGRRCAGRGGLDTYLLSMDWLSPTGTVATYRCGQLFVCLAMVHTEKPQALPSMS